LGSFGGDIDTPKPRWNCKTRVYDLVVFHSSLFCCDQSGEFFGKDNHIAGGMVCCRAEMRILRVYEGLPYRQIVTFSAVTTKEVLPLRWQGNALGFNLKTTLITKDFNILLLYWKAAANHYLVQRDIGKNNPISTYTETVLNYVERRRIFYRGVYTVKCF